MSPGCEIIAKRLAKTMRRWLHRLDGASPGGVLDPGDIEIINRLREAVASGVLTVSHPMFTPIMPALGDLKGLCERVVELWSILLGNTQWATDTQSTI